jgi:capsular polysaccharide transport system permease protein
LQKNQDDKMLTGLQLRAARRMAQKHGLTTVSDVDAVKQLQGRGIDPFARTAQLALVGDDKNRPDEKLPVASTAANREPSPTPVEARSREIAQIQKDMVRQRRRRMRALLVRLFIFVVIPGILAGFYYARIATPLFATSSEFLIIKNDGGSSSGLLSGTQFATNQDAIAVQNFLLSKEAMLRLDDDIGFRNHFSSPNLDFLTRLDPDSSIEAAHSLYLKMVRIGFDPSEGILRMEIRAADPETATRYAQALIDYAEDRVDHLSKRKRDAALNEAQQELADATDARREAQLHLITLQQKTALIDPKGRIASLRGQINSLEMQLQDKSLRLASLQSNFRAPSARIESILGEIQQLESLLTDLKAQMTNATRNGQSLAAVATEIDIAQHDLSTRDMLLQAAMDRLGSARRDASAQARYLSVSVSPIDAQEPVYPRVYYDTALAFLIAAGLYLMASLTVSILKEQL